MRMGHFRHRVTIQQQGAGQDAWGAPSAGWSEVVTTWAAIEDQSGADQFSAEHYRADVTHRVRIRYRSGLSPDMRILYDGREFDILHIVNVYERDRQLHLLCKERVN